MKKLLVIVASLFIFGHSFCQSSTVENEIRRLEQMEVKAVLEKDTITLGKLWDKQFVVHNPESKIIVAVANSVARPVLNQPRLQFTREVEHLTVNGDIVISMGSETVVPGGETGNPGKTIKRRYTNVWMKVDGSWKLVARHANVVAGGN
jgi:hypothetical protein